MADLSFLDYHRPAYLSTLPGLGAPMFGAVDAQRNIAGDEASRESAALLPAKVQGAGLENQQRTVELNKVKLQQAQQMNLINKMPEGFTEADTAAVGEYVKNHGVPPLGPDGKYDLGAVNTQLGKDLQFEQNVKMAQYSPVINGELVGGGPGPAPAVPAVPTTPPVSAVPAVPAPAASDLAPAPSASTVSDTDLGHPLPLLGLDDVPLIPTSVSKVNPRTGSYETYHLITPEQRIEQRKELDAENIRRQTYNTDLAGKIHARQQSTAGEPEKAMAGANEKVASAEAANLPEISQAWDSVQNVEDLYNEAVKEGAVGWRAGRWTELKNLVQEGRQQTYEQALGLALPQLARKVLDFPSRGMSAGSGGGEEPLEVIGFTKNTPLKSLLPDMTTPPKVAAEMFSKIKGALRTKAHTSMKQLSVLGSPEGSGISESLKNATTRFGSPTDAVEKSAPEGDSALKNISVTIPGPDGTTPMRTEVPQPPPGFIPGQHPGPNGIQYGFASTDGTKFIAVPQLSNLSQARAAWKAAQGGKADTGFGPEFLDSKVRNAGAAVLQQDVQPRRDFGTLPDSR